MKAREKIQLFLFVSVSTALAGGCSIGREPIGFVPVSDFEAVRSDASVARRFEGTSTQGATELESAIELSGKYASLSDKATALRQEKQELLAENLGLKKQVGALETELKQAQKELTEANDLLREMVIELNNWKSSVMGFREEVRGADKAQLQALLKILRVLGGQVNEETVQSEQDGKNAGATVASESGSAKLQSK